MTEQKANIDAVLQRLNTIERQNRNLRRGLFLLLVFFGATIAVGFKLDPSKEKDIITAKKFILVDSHGNERGHWDSERLGPDNNLSEFEMQTSLNKIDLRVDQANSLMQISDGAGDIATIGTHNDKTSAGISQGVFLDIMSNSATPSTSVHITGGDAVCITDCSKGKTKVDPQIKIIPSDPKKTWTAP
jgi:hypothetical protein